MKLVTGRISGIGHAKIINTTKFTNYELLRMSISRSNRKNISTNEFMATWRQNKNVILPYCGVVIRLADYIILFINTQDKLIMSSNAE